MRTRRADGRRPTRRETGGRVSRTERDERGGGGGGGEQCARARTRVEKKTGEKARAAGGKPLRWRWRHHRPHRVGWVPPACGTPHWLSAKHTAPSDRRRHRHRHRQTVGAADAPALTYIPFPSRSRPGRRPVRPGRSGAAVRFRPPARPPADSAAAAAEPPRRVPRRQLFLNKPPPPPPPLFNRCFISA